MRFDDLQLIACFELLLGAAWADGDFAESERSALFELFCGMTGADRLTAEAQRLFGTFRPDRLDLDRACAALGFRAGRPPTDAVERRRAFLTLLGRVVDADEILEGGEGVYIGRLAERLGAGPSDFAQLLEHPADAAAILARPTQGDQRAGERLDARFTLERARMPGGLDGRFIARDMPLGQRRAEVRFLCPYTPASQRRTLLREALAVSATGSPHVAAVYDIGGLREDGAAYIVTEPLRGETLRTRLARGGRLAPRETLAIIDGVLAGLEAAHAAGIVHRALTVDEIFLVNAPGVRDHVKLTGFGTTRLFAEELDGGEPLLDATSSVAPERLGGAPVDQRADLFSVASIAWHCLTGQPPFGGEQRPGACLAVRRARVRRAPILGEVDKGLRALDPAIGPNLSIDAADRMPDAATMRAAFSEVMLAV